MLLKWTQTTWLPDVAIVVVVVVVVVAGEPYALPQISPEHVVPVADEAVIVTVKAAHVFEHDPVTVRPLATVYEKTFFLN